jgi:hypothetical protein
MQPQRKPLLVWQRAYRYTGVVVRRRSMPLREHSKRTALAWLALIAITLLTLSLLAALPAIALPLPTTHIECSQNAPGWRCNAWNGIEACQQPKSTQSDWRSA